MSIPQGYAAIPLQESDFLDFIFNYFKAEYAPIRSFWSTATAVPTLPERWINMGHDLSPLQVRPANAQAQKDIEFVDFCTRKWNLDADFVRGLVTRYAKYELHDRLEKKVFEAGRLDLMLRKSLKEKHLIDALWPSPAPRNLPTELLQQGVQVRKWYGDMFHKYFRVLHSVDDFTLRPEIDARIKAVERLMMVPFVDHLIFGTAEPIMPIVAMGTGYTKARGSGGRNLKALAYGEPDRFEIRFDAPADVTDTYTKSVARQCQCMKCGAKRDVQVTISIDPTLEFGTAFAGPSISRTNDGGPSSAQRRNASKVAQKYSPGYNMPGGQEQTPRLLQRPQAEPQNPVPARATSPQLKKQCPRCTFLNHPELTSCEMCQATLPDVLVTKSPTPPAAPQQPETRQPAPSKPRADTMMEEERPSLLNLNRNSLSQSLLSIFPYSPQQLQQQQSADQQPQQQQKSPTKSSHLPKSVSSSLEHKAPAPTLKHEHIQQQQQQQQPPIPQPPRVKTPPLSQPPELAMMPMTPPSNAASAHRAPPSGLPSNLMDDFVPVSPGFVHEEEDVDAGWGEMSREEAKGGEDGEEDEEEEGEGGQGKKGYVDLDEVAREEADVWGEREDD